MRTVQKVCSMPKFLNTEWIHDTYPRSATALQSDRLKRDLNCWEWWMDPTFLQFICYYSLVFEKSFLIEKNVYSYEKKEKSHGESIAATRTWTHSYAVVCRCRTWAEQIDATFPESRTETLMSKHNNNAPENIHTDYWLEFKQISSETKRFYRALSK